MAEPEGSVSPGYVAPRFAIDRLDLEVELDAALTHVRAEIAFRRADPAARDLWLDGVGLELLEIRLDGRPVEPSRCELAAEGLWVRDVPDVGVLSVRNTVRPGGPGDEGLIRLGEVLVTHCEPEGFRRITYFPDRPDVMAPYRCALVAEEARYPTLLCNGAAGPPERLANGRHRVTWTDERPKSSYLFALAAGRFATLDDRFVTRSGRAVALAVHAPAAADLTACEHGLATLKAAMAWDERTYGLEYGRDRLNVVVMRDYPGGAMENPGLNLYATEFFQAHPATSTDAQIRRITSSVAHEYFHDWSGNRVGCRSWLDLTVKEGLTVLREQQFMADLIGADARIDDVAFLRARQYPEDDGEMAHAARPASAAVASNLYTRTVYEKGAEIFRMLGAWIGEAAFRATLDQWFLRFDGRPASVEDFVGLAEALSGDDLSGFRQWWRQVGAVEVSVTTEATPDGRRLTVRQTPARPDAAFTPLPLPIAAGLVAPSGAPTAVVQLRAQAECETFRLEGAAEDVPSLFRGYSAAVRLRQTLALADLATLARCDDDPVNRWDSAQTLAVRATLDDDLQGAASQAWLELFGALAPGALTNPGVVGRLLALPSEATVALAMDPVDVERIAGGRRRLASAAGQRYADALRAWRDDLEAAAAAPADYGARRLRNLALGLLSEAGDPDAWGAAVRQLEQAPTLEDQASALQVLVDAGGARREDGLDRARRAWGHDPHRFDQWFAAQAASTAPDAAHRLALLARDGSLDGAGATRIKGVYDALAANLGAFHASSGAGYEVMAQAVAGLGPVNPRLAARFASAFAGWRRLDPPRQMKLLGVVERLAGRADLGIEATARIDAILAGDVRERTT